MLDSGLRSRSVFALVLVLVVGALLFGARPERADAGLQFLMGDTDCNSSVTSVDATIVLQYSARLFDTVPCARNAHLNSDALITSVDATILLQYVARLLDHLTPVPSYEGSVVSLGSDQCRALDAGGDQQYVLSDPTAGTPGQSIRVWGFLDYSTSQCGVTPLLRIVAVVVLS